MSIYRLSLAVCDSKTNSVSKRDSGRETIPGFIQSPIGYSEGNTVADGITRATRLYVQEGGPDGLCGCLSNIFHLPAIRSLHLSRPATALHTAGDKASAQTHADGDEAAGEVPHTHRLGRDGALVAKVGVLDRSAHVVPEQLRDDARLE